MKLAALWSVSVHSHVGHATAQAAKEAGPEQRLGDLDSTGSASRQRQQEIINIQALRVSGLKDRWVRVDGYVMRGITGAKTIAASTAGLALGYASSEHPRR